MSVLRYIGSISTPDKATLKAEAQALQCPAAGQKNAFPISLLGVGSVCVLGPDLVGIDSISLAARYRTAACSNTLSQGLQKIQAARAFDFAPILALCPSWENEFLTPSMARATADAFNIVCRLDHDGKLNEVSQDNKQKVATSLLRDKLKTQDFGGPISSRASKDRSAVIELWTSCSTRNLYRAPLVLDSLLVFCASFFATGYLRLNDFTFQTEGDEQTCRVGCPNVPGSLSHYNECPLLCNMFVSIWGQATVLPRRSHLLHDLITQVFLRCLQYGIVVMAFIDAFVYAHHQHRRSIDNPGNFGDCMKGRLRFMPGNA